MEQKEKTDKPETRTERLERALRVIARSSIDRFTRHDALMALADDPRKRD